jgi:hypothetical protein
MKNYQEQLLEQMKSAIKMSQLKARVKELEAQEAPYEVEVEMAENFIIRMDYANFVKFMKEMQNGGFN